MADKLTLEFQKRDLFGKKVGRLRRAGIMPATVYGKGVGPFSVQIDARTFQDVYRRAGRTKLVELTIPGEKTQSAFVHTIQRHPVSRAITHADLLVVDLKVEVTVAVPVHMIGESPLAKQGVAVVSLVMAQVEVRALPAEIPSHIEADVSQLESLEKNILVSDLIAPSSGTIVSDPDEVVVSITAARLEQEEAAEAAEAEATEPELVREDREGDGDS